MTSVQRVGKSVRLEREIRALLRIFFPPYSMIMGTTEGFGTEAIIHVCCTCGE